MFDLIYNLKNRSGLYLLDDTYKGLVSFLMGYQFAIFQIKGKDLSNDFQNWLRIKVGHHFSVHWSSYILIEISEGDEILARTYLLNLLEEFFIEANDPTDPDMPPKSN